MSQQQSLEGIEMKGGAEWDGLYLVIEDEKRNEAEIKVKQWLGKLGIHSAVK